MFRFKSYFVSFCFSFLCVGLFYSSVFSATLIVEGGQLMGANNVLVNGVYYNVEFVDGSANALYKGGDGFSFTFTDSEQARQATEALFSDVFL